jgi:hypothetical protein
VWGGECWESAGVSTILYTIQGKECGVWGYQQSYTLYKVRSVCRYNSSYKLLGKECGAITIIYTI